MLYWRSGRGTSCRIDGKRSTLMVDVMCPLWSLCLSFPTLLRPLTSRSFALALKFQPSHSSTTDNPGSFMLAYHPNPHRVPKLNCSTRTTSLKMWTRRWSRPCESTSLVSSKDRQQRHCEGRWGWVNTYEIPYIIIYNHSIYIYIDYFLDEHPFISFINHFGHQGTKVWTSSHLFAAMMLDFHRIFYPFSANEIRTPAKGRLLPESRQTSQGHPGQMPFPESRLIIGF